VDVLAAKNEDDISGIWVEICSIHQEKLILKEVTKRVKYGRILYSMV
jgi:hypothetical protein